MFSSIRGNFEVREERSSRIRGDVYYWAGTRFSTNPLTRTELPPRFRSVSTPPYTTYASFSTAYGALKNVVGRSSKRLFHVRSRKQVTPPARTPARARRSLYQGCTPRCVHFARSSVMHISCRTRRKRAHR